MSATCRESLVQSHIATELAYGEFHQLSSDGATRIDKSCPSSAPVAKNTKTRLKVASMHLGSAPLAPRRPGWGAGLGGPAEIAGATD